MTAIGEGYGVGLRWGLALGLLGTLGLLAGTVIVADTLVGPWPALAWYGLVLLAAALAGGQASHRTGRLAPGPAAGGLAALLAAALPALAAWGLAALVLWWGGAPASTHARVAGMALAGAGALLPVGAALGAAAGLVGAVVAR